MSDLKKPKLSTAILEGCKIVKKQAIGSAADSSNMSACALGTACIYIDLKFKENKAAILAAWDHERHNPKGELFLMACPYCTLDGFSPGGLVVHLNDTHEKSREAIAKFLIKHGR